MSKTKNFVVRWFEPRVGTWDSKGVMEDLYTFNEEVAEVHNAAVDFMTEFSQIGEQLVKINLSFRIDQAYTYADVRSFRTVVREVLKRWAEKCRVKGVRGWRTNAVREIEVGKDGEIRATIILGTNVYYKYDGKKLHWTNCVERNTFHFADDLELLKRQLEKETRRTVTMNSTSFFFQLTFE